MTQRRIYKLPQQDIITSGAPTGLLTTGFGGYFCIDDQLSYQGWYQLLQNWRMQKIIESITPLDEGACTSLYNHLYALRREYASGATEHITPYQKVLLYTTQNLSGRILITLDGRESYETSRLGRFYDIRQIDDYRLLIHFTQHNDDGKLEHEHYICIKGFSSIELLQNWKEKQYAFDHHRGAQSTYWVFEALTCIPKRHVVFSFGKTESEAITLADIAYVHYDDIQSNVHLSKLEHIDIHALNQMDTKVHAATQLATNSLRSLLTTFTSDHQYYEGIYAGLPWFFQIWSRDELISLGGVLALAKQRSDDALLHTCKSILFRHLQSVRDDGMLPNRYPHSELGSIDALGWLSKRCIDFITLLKERKQLFTFFTLHELQAWKNMLKLALNRSQKHSKHEILFTNEFCETWMDTSYNDDGRSGIRIEIQALFLCVYDAILLIETVADSSVEPELEVSRNLFIEMVRKHFIHANYPMHIIDGLDVDGHIDTAIRPNLFLAYYLAPELFTSADWDIALPYYVEKLYLPWGGFATLSTDSALFQPQYTGQDNKSYHRGDSWYFVNNFIALILHRYDKARFEKEIQAVLNASTKDILDQGLAGHGSEVSSAHNITSEACLAQAWSVASFIEAIDEIYDKPHE